LQGLERAREPASGSPRRCHGGGLEEAPVASASPVQPCLHQGRSTLDLARVGRPGAPDTVETVGACARVTARVARARLELEPTTATSLGLKTGYDRWPDASEQGDAARNALAERQLAELRKFDPARLDDATRLSWQVFEANEERRIARYRWRNHHYLFDKDGAHASVPAFLINTHRIESDADAVAYVRRLEGIRTLFAQELGRARAAQRDRIPDGVAGGIAQIEYEPRERGGARRDIMDAPRHHVESSHRDIVEPAAAHSTPRSRCPADSIDQSYRREKK